MMLRFSLTTSLVLALAACAPQAVETASDTGVKSSKQASSASGFDKTLAAAERKISAVMGAPITVPVPKAVSYTHLTLPTKRIV